MLSPRRRRRTAPPSSASAPPAARNWAALPGDVLFTIILKLGPLGIMRGADHACTAWRRVAVHEPSLWRRVDMGKVPLWSVRWRAAVDRSGGQCEAFSGHFWDDESLLYLVERTPYLKSLRLLYVNVSEGVLSDAIKKVPLLEYLEMSIWEFITPGYDKLIQSICETCPYLKKLSLKLITSLSPYIDDYMDDSDKNMKNYPIPMMRELRSLELTGEDLTLKKLLMAIIDSCPVLESLYVTGHFAFQMVEELQPKYARVKIVAVAADSVESIYDS